MPEVTITVKLSLKEIEDVITEVAKDSIEDSSSGMSSKIKFLLDSSANGGAQVIGAWVIFDPPNTKN